MQPFIVQWPVAVGAAGCATTLCASTLSHCLWDLLWLEKGGGGCGWAGIPSMVLLIPNPDVLGAQGHVPGERHQGAPWQGKARWTQCKQIWWKAEGIPHVSRITPAREEERSPMSLSYLTLQSTMQQY